MHNRARILACCSLAFAVVALNAGLAGATASLLWSAHYGTPGAGARGFSICVDASGNVLVAGGFSGTVNFGGSGLTALGTDVFMAKYNASGQHVWSKRFGGTAADQAYAVTFDASGNAFITGYFRDVTDFGGPGFQAVGGSDLFVAKYDPDGNHLWSKTFGTADSDIGYAIAADNTGSVVVTGYLHGIVPSDIFVARYDADGLLQWVKTIGSDGYDEGLSIAVDTAANVVVTGSFEGTVDFGGGGLTAGEGGWDAFVAKYAPDGTHLWSQRFGGLDFEAGTAIKTDPSDNVVVAGYFAGSVSFGGTPLVSTGSDVDIFLASYDPDGNHLWSERQGGSSYENASALAIDASSNIFMTGYFDGTASFGGANLESNGNVDAFIASYNSNGSHLASRCFGDVGVDAAQAIAVSSSGDRYVAGYFSGTADLGGEIMTSYGVPDVFLAKYGTISSVDRGPRAGGLELLAVPNPFNPSTMLRYRLPVAGPVRIAVYDARGRMVTTLVDGTGTAGEHSVLWQGLDHNGEPAASGVYFARIVQAGIAQTHKLVLLK